MQVLWFHTFFQETDNGIAIGRSLKDEAAVRAKSPTGSTGACGRTFGSRHNPTNERGPA